MKAFWMVVGLAAGMAAQAGNYSIDWYKISSGGGTSTGANFKLTGTIGQIDTCQMAGGGLILTSGFWSFIGTVSTLGAPRLGIAVLGSTATLSWPSTSGFVLEQNNTATPVGWTAVPDSCVTNQDTISVSVKVLPGTKFYRLVGSGK